MASRSTFPLDPAANAAAVDQVLADLRRRMLAGRWTAESRTDPPDEATGRTKTLRCRIEIEESGDPLAPGSVELSADPDGTMRINGEPVTGRSGGPSSR